MHVSAVAEEDRFKLSRFKSNCASLAPVPFILLLVKEGVTDPSLQTIYVPGTFEGSVGKAPSIAISLHLLQYSLHIFV